MPKFLKGNYRLPKGKADVITKKKTKKDLTDRLEETALSKLGGSLCFVMKKGTFVWNDPHTGAPPPAGGARR